MAFRPSNHGWPFGNVHSCTPSGLGIGAPPLPDLGLGGGMCWSALDRYLRGLRIDRGMAAPEEGEPLHAELVRRQVSAMAGSWPKVRDWQARPDGSWRDRLPVRLPVPGRDLASLTRAEWRRVRKSLDRDRPVLLTLLARADGYTRSRAAWQVLATGYTRRGRRVKVSVYDPGRPNDDDIRLGFSVAGPLEAGLVGGPGIRGFFAVAYDRDPAEPLRAETFGDRSVIGLNRTVRGRVAPAAARGGLDLVARDSEGSLLHFRRAARGKSWDGANVTERNKLGAYELHCDPAAARVGRALHVFARSHVGDLLHFRLGRAWSVANRTDHRRAGARFRIQSTPVVATGRRFRLSVLGRDEDGGLIHYDGSPFARWRAEQVAGQTLVDEPVAEWVGETLHVVGLAPRGHLIHWQRDEDRWTVTDLSEKGGPGGECVGRPALAAPDGRVHVFSRDADGRLLLMTPDAEGLWQLSVLAGNLAGDPVATPGPAGLHVFAPTLGGGMLHAWRVGDWRSEDIVATRPSLPEQPPFDGPIACWGSRSALRVFGHHAGDLVVYDWSRDGDWTVDALADWAGVEERHRIAARPTLFLDGDGRPHLVGTDGRGTVVHVEPGPWAEPGAERAPVPASRKRERKPRRTKVVATPAPDPTTAPEPGPEPEPLPLLDGPGPGETAAESDTAGVPYLDFDIERRAEPEAGVAGEAVEREAATADADAPAEPAEIDDSGPAVIAPDIIEIAMEGELGLLHPHAAENVDAPEPGAAGASPPDGDTDEEDGSEAVALEDILLEDPDDGAVPDEPAAAGEEVPEAAARGPAEEPGRAEVVAEAGEPDGAEEPGTSEAPGDETAEPVPVATGPEAREDGDDEPVEQYPRPREAPGEEPDDLDERIDISLIGNWPPPPPSGRKKRRGDRREAS